jgi:hypothetical protein
MTDYWGNDALDFGVLSELTKKYSNKFIVSVSNKPFGNSYVLFVCNADDEEKAERYLDDYRTLMRSKSIMAYGLGISLGSDLEAERMDNFQGGVSL